MTIKGMGPDTQLIAAQPGEIVMSKGAVNMYGADTLLSMNKMGGGTNKPSMGYPVMPMYGGGMISNVNIGNQLMDRGITQLRHTTTGRIHRWWYGWSFW